MDFDAILSSAYKAAADAQAGLVEDMNALDCGFAWVTVKGNTAFAKWCKQQADAASDRWVARNYGSKGYPKGWKFWCPGSFGGQSMPIHLAGAEAFAYVLQANNIEADVGCRYD